MRIFKFSKKFFSWSKRVSEQDPELYSILQKEVQRQVESVNLIASENFTCQSVLDILGSPLQNKYSEGYPGKRYYGGNDYIDMVESLCQKRALETYRLNTDQWGVNVQAYSGAPANIYTYAALLNLGDKVMGLRLSHGGHLSHGFSLPNKKVHWTSELYDWKHYELGDNDLIDYDALYKQAMEFKPKLILAGYSAYPRHYDYKRMREICDEVDAILMSDMAHISGPVAANLCPDPFQYSHVVTTTSHKTLRGPRGAMIFAIKDFKGRNLIEEVNEKVFPGIQGGPHNHSIGALATTLLDAQTPQFKEYQKQTLQNAKAFAEQLGKEGFDIVTGGTDNHIILVSLKKFGVDGGRYEHVLNSLNISANKNTIRGDLSAMKPSGMRLGTPAMTTRGCTEQEFQKITEFMKRALDITLKYNTFNKLINFKKKIDKISKTDKDFIALNEEIKEFCRNLKYHFNKIEQFNHY